MKTLRTVQSRLQSGQMLVITLLVLTIAITIALALISRTTTDVSISNQVEDSARAFNAAEAGIEDSLKSGQGANAQILANGSQYTSSVATIGGATGVFSFPTKALLGITQTLWLTNHEKNGSLNDSWTTDANSIGAPYTGTTIDVCWSKETVIPAMEISIWKDSIVYRRTYDPDTTRNTSNNFSNVTASTGTNCGQTNTYRQHLTFTTDFNANILTTTPMLMMRIRPIYSDANIWIDTGTNVLPPQGSQVTSVGTSGANVTRKIVVYQQYRAPLNLFDNVLYSQQDLAQ